MQTGKVKGFIFHSSTTLKTLADKKEISASIFPSLKGDVVIFAGLDCWMFARGKYGYKGPAWVVDVPVVFERAGIPIKDGMYARYGVWRKQKPDLGTKFVTVDLQQTLVKHIILANAKRLHKLAQDHPQVLKSKHFRQELFNIRQKLQQEKRDAKVQAK